jgi:hypothetical protein
MFGLPGKIADKSGELVDPSYDSFPYWFVCRTSAVPRAQAQFQKV